MEVICANLVEPDQVVLVGCNGLWGERFAEIAYRQGITELKERMTVFPY